MTDAERWDRIQELFHQVAEMEPSEQIVVLQRECGNNSAVVDEVRRMLLADAQSASLLDGGLAEIAGQVLSASSTTARKQIGPWELRHVLGEGGMGTVFYAERADLGTSAAIKVLRDSWLSPARRERFVREQHTLAHLDHPNIARLLDASTLKDGTPYFVMEYVEGLHLDNYCETHSLSIDTRLRLFRSMCEAVQFAHGRAVIHRDLKPSNVLVDRSGAVKLLDFGVSKQVDDFDAGSDLTRTGLRLLTPAFASPEQLRGEPASVSADVYSLGVILYRLLTGRLPFDELRDNSSIAMVDLNRHVVRPSLVARQVDKKREVASGEGISPSAWADVDVICLKSMHNDPRQRYVSAEALIRDIDHYLAGEPLEARPDSLGYRANKFVRRHRVAVAIAVVGVTALAVLILAFTARLAQERNAALAEAARTQRIQQFMRTLFEGGDADAGPSHDLRVATLLDKGVLEAAAMENDPAIQAELYQTLAEIYRKLGDLRRADELFASALASRRVTDGNSSAGIAETTGMLAALRVDQAKLDEAERLGRESLEMSRRTLPEGHPSIAAATERLGRILEEKGEYREAIPLLEQAVRQRASGQQAADIAGARYELANAYFYAGRYKEAEALNQKVLAVNRQIYGEKHPRVAEVLINLGAVQQDLGNYSEAEKYHRQALAITRAFYGDTHYRTAASLTMVARSLVYQKRYDDAVPLLRNALAVQEGVFGPVHPRVASALNELGTVALQKGDTDAAKTHFRRMLDIYNSVYPGGHNLVGTATSNLASAHLAAREYGDAEPLFRKAIALFSRTLSAEHLSTAIARVKLGRTLLREKRYREAEAESRAGYKILRSQMNPSVSWLNSTRADLAEVYAALGMSSEETAIRAELAASGARK